MPNLLRLLFLAGFLLPIYSFGYSVKDSLLLQLENDNLTDIELFHINYELANISTTGHDEVKYGLKAFELAKMINYEMGKCIASRETGYGYSKLGDYDLAIHYFYISLKSAEKLNRINHAAVAYENIGICNLRQKDYKQALENLHYAAKLKKDTENKRELGVVFNNVGEVYRYMDKFDSALYYFKIADDIFKQVNDSFAWPYSTGNLGMVYAKIGRLNEARQLLEEAITSLKKNNDTYPIPFFLNSLAEIEIEKNNINQALHFANEAHSLATTDENKELIRDAAKTLATIYEIKSDYKQAYHYKEQYINYRDSINNEETIRNIAELKTEYEVSKKQAEVDLLTKERNIQVIISIALSVTAMLVSVLSIILYRNYKSNKRINGLLQEQKEELEAQTEELTKVNAVKDKFFSIISHDLRGPVSSFHGISGMIKHYVERHETDQILEITDYIDKSVRHLSMLLDNLLDWSMNQQGRFPNRPEKLYLLPLVELVVQTFENMATDKKIGIEYEIDTEISIFADRNSVVTILRNLVHNALKFTYAKKNIHIISGKTDTFATIAVVDEGVGMSKEKIANIFTLKDKKSSYGTSNEKGMGLGLRLAYEFVEMNKGRIEVQSEIGKGTCFTVFLPLYD